VLYRDKEPYVRSAAAKALGEIKDPRAVKALLWSATYDKMWTVRNDSKKMLINFGIGGLDEMVKLMKHKSKYARTSIILAIGNIKDPKVLDLLILAMKDDLYQRNTGFCHFR